MTGPARIQSRADAEALDRADPLSAARDAFKLPPDTIYLVGHSLGPATHTSLQRLQQAAGDEWSNGLVGAWNSAGWIDLAKAVGAKIAPLIGVASDNVLIADSVSVNLFKLAAAALPLSGGEQHIRVEENEFPTDQYIGEALGQLTDHPFRRIAAGTGETEIARGGVLIKSLVNYRTSEVYDMTAHERAARQGNGLIIWDLSHATGIINVDLASAGAKLAVGCTYKYLNGGPGAPAFIYAAPDMAGRLQTPLPGWMGHAAPFDFSRSYTPAEGIQRFAAGTPPILSLSALDGALDVFSGVDIRDIQAKSSALGDLCQRRADAMGINVVDPGQRGGHVCLTHASGYPIVQALAARNIFADFRTPDTIRLGFSPLFLRYVDIWDTMDALKDILRSGSWDQPEFHRRAKVT